MLCQVRSHDSYCTNECMPNHGWNCWEHAANRNRNTTCRDCGDVVSLYMVHDHIWEALVPEDPHDMSFWVCHECLGIRMGEPITTEHLNDAMCNDDWKTL
jgi:hypothetical protein